MIIKQYQVEWLEFVGDKGSRTDGLQYVYDNVFIPILQENPFFFRCKTKKENSGVCKIVEEFDGYIKQGIWTEKKEEIKQFLELAFVFWLFGIRLKEKYRSILQKRINQFFQGNTYYENEYTGFRQFEFELHIIARFVEEDIPIADIEEENQPDLLVSSDTHPFYVEIKMPTSSIESSIKKAICQIKPKERSGAIIIGLDHILANTEEKGMKDCIDSCITTAKSLVEGTSIVVFIEYIPNDDSGSAIHTVVDEALFDPNVYKVVQYAMTGQHDGI